MAQDKKYKNCDYIQVRGTCFTFHFGNEEIVLPRWRGGPTPRNGCSIDVFESENGLKTYALSSKENELIGDYIEKKDGSMEFKYPIYEPTQDRNLLNEKPESYGTISIPAETMEMVRADINNTEKLINNDAWSNNKIIFEKHGNPEDIAVTSALLFGTFGAGFAVEAGAAVPVFFGGAMAGAVLAGCYVCGRDLLNKLREKRYKKNPPNVTASIRNRGRV